MSDRKLLSLLLVLAVPTALHGQGLAALQAERIRLLHELDSLRALKPKSSPMDTLLTTGGWTVVVSPSVRAQALQEAPAALEALNRDFGGALDPATPVLITYDTVVRRALQVTIGKAERTDFDSRAPASGDIASLVRSAGVAAIWAEADPALRSWTGDESLPYESFAYLAPATRIRLQHDTGAAVAGCRLARLDACVLALDGDSARRHPPEFGSVVRGSLFWFALDHAGGRRAIPRLFADPTAPVLDRLATVAGMSPTELVAEWRGAVLSEDSLNLGTAAAAIGGAFVMLLLARWGIQWRRV